MENEIVTPVIEPISPRKQEAEKIHKKFKITVRLLLFVGIVVVAVVTATNLSFRVYNESKDRYKKLPEKELLEEKQTPQNETPASTTKTFSDENLGFEVTYKAEDILETSSAFSESELYIQITSKQFNDYGYYVKISLLNLSTKTLQESVKLKRESMIVACPTTSNIGVIAESKIGNLNTLGFEVADCKLNYIINYGQIGNKIYEITQAYKGDIGYEQVFKTETETIANSIKFNIPLEKTENPTTKKYENKALNLYFEYPYTIDTTCCTAEIPQGKNIQKILGVSEGNAQQTASFFLFTNPNKIPFDTFVAEQITALSDEYKIVKGILPEGLKENIKIGDYDAVKLTDYSWRKSTYIIAPIAESSQILIISDMGINSDILTQILNSIKMGKQEL